jgi:coniferyl-aldehyde dehydrogenase
VPTLLLGVDDAMAVMQQEIFGPLLPIVPYDTVDDAVSYVQGHDRPLALYWFGTDAEARRHVLERTHAGGVTVNDCVWHFAQENQPFGGIGASGMGAYHGEAGFRTFSKEKPVFVQSRFAGTRLFQPPYGRTFERLLSAIRRLAA